MELYRAIHAQVHSLMVEGLIPTTLRVGWVQYGQLRRLLSAEPDAARPRAVLGLEIVPVDERDHLEVLALDRRM